MNDDDKCFSTIRMMRDFRTFEILDDELGKIIRRPQFPKETNSAAAGRRKCNKS
jgi:hypothetical protein